MHVLILPSEEYIPENNPIAGIFQHDQAKIILNKGNKVGVISFSFKHSFFSLLKALLMKKGRFTKNLNFSSILRLIFQKTFQPFSSSCLNETVDNISVVRCDGFWGFKNSAGPLSRYEMWLKYGGYALDEYIKRFGKPDIIHAHNMIYAGLLAIYLKQRYQIPVVVTEHSSQYAMEEIPSQLFFKLNEAFITDTPFYAVSPKLIELLENKFPSLKSNMSWLPNVLDPKVENIPVPKYSNSSKFRFLNVANLIPLKGQLELIQAFSRIVRNDDNVELIIVGDGILKNDLQQEIKKLKLTNKIRMLGLLNREKVIAMMDECDVLVLPSHYETFGVVLIEALSRGKPVISTYCGGPECIVNVNNGLLVEPKNILQLEEAMIKMIKIKSNFDDTFLRNQCIKDYGADGFYNKIKSIYNQFIIKH